MITFKTKLIFSAAMLGLLSLPMIASAEKTVQSGKFKSAVVELYTSEGCSSCPPADSFLSRLGKTEEADAIIPLAFHVDYWDYIGWEDPYAQAKFTKRQRHIGNVNGQSSIYTPEFVVDGKEARGGNRIANQVKTTQGALSEADITLMLTGEQSDNLSANILLENIQQTDDEAVVYLALTESKLSSQIDAGENSGRKLKHDYVVRFLSQPMTALEGENHQFSIALEDDWQRDNLTLAVLVKQKLSGKTLQALKTTL